MNNSSLSLKYFIDKIKESEYAHITILAVAVGVLAGFGAILFKYTIEGIQWLFYGGAGELYYVIEKAPFYQKLLVPSIGGLIVGLIIYFFASEAKGHGVPEVMSAVALRGGIIRRRVAGAKAIASAISIGTGSSVGSEGPIVQIGSALGSVLGQSLNFSGKKMKSMVACGAAAGIAAIFNAPIAGVMFSLEVILGDLAFSTFSPLVISAVTATIISRAWWGDVPVFHVPKYELVSPLEIPAYIMLGLISAVVAVSFSKALYGTEDFFNNKVKIPPYFKAAIGGLMIGAIGIFSPHIFGVGYHVIDMALLGEMPFYLLFALIFLKIIATSLSLGSGSSGGVFAPSLFIGAATGGAFGKIAHAIFPTLSASSGAYALVGMGAVVAGSTYAPITAIMIIFEMTSDYKIILPLMLTCITSTLFASYLSKESIYTMKLARQGINLQAGKEVNILQSILVKEAMAKGAQSIPENMTLRQFNQFLTKSKYSNFPVVDENKMMTGIISFQDFKEVIFESGLEDLIVVKELATENVITITAEENLDDAFKKIGTKNIEQLPVVSKNNPKKIVGMLSRRDIISAYNKGLLEQSLKEQ
ncbi:MAG: chloride channel protein [Deltaproteobacteria bacterium]|nr:chloride channel protein [Deltaproteobacteria bacterium]